MQTILDTILEELEQPPSSLICAGKETTSSCFTLDYVKCHKTEDWGADECLLRIYVDGVRKKTLRKTMNDGQRWPLGYSFPFDDKVVVKLWDEDSPDPDDLIGTLKIDKKTMAGTKDLTATKNLRGHGAHYSIKYNVKHSSPPIPEPPPPLVIIDDPIGPISPGLSLPREIPGPDVHSSCLLGLSKEKRIRRINSIRKHWSKSIFRLVQAKARINQLDELPPNTRRTTWKKGPEKTFFGLYSKAGFRKIKRIFENIHKKLISPEFTIECYCIHEDCPKKEKFWGKSSSALDKFYLGYWWFHKPDRLSESQWETEKTQTFIHEAAHLVGITRTLFDEKYEEDAKRLARVNPVGARRNADNYGYYVMRFK